MGGGYFDRRHGRAVGCSRQRDCSCSQSCGLSGLVDVERTSPVLIIVRPRDASEVPFDDAHIVQEVERRVLIYF